MKCVMCLYEGIVIPSHYKVIRDQTGMVRVTTIVCQGGGAPKRGEQSEFPTTTRKKGSTQV